MSQAALNTAIRSAPVPQGRRHVTGDLREPMVLDWRAPLSRSFYRARVPDSDTLRVGHAA